MPLPGKLKAHTDFQPQGFGFIKNLLRRLLALATRQVRKVLPPKVQRRHRPEFKARALNKGFAVYQQLVIAGFLRIKQRWPWGVAKLFLALSTPR